MHPARAWLSRVWPRALVALLVLPGCGRSASTPDGAWRDQFIFVSDDGTVLSVGINRQSTGRAEAKAWLGRARAWESVFYKEFAIERQDAPVLTATLDRLANARAIKVNRVGRGLDIKLRTPDRAVEMTASDMAELGRTTDPEGTTIYRAGRVHVQDNSAQLEGWLIAEETPAGEPRRPFIDYGDFVFVVLASQHGGVLVAKRSLDHPEFDHAFVSAPVARHTDDVAIEVGADDLRVELDQLGRAGRYRTIDRNTSRGIGPNGNDVVYETLFLGGDNAGIAFAIRPEKETNP